MWCFRRSDTLGATEGESKSVGSEWESPARRGSRVVRRFAASRRAEPQARCVGEVRRALVVEWDLRIGRAGAREPF